LYSYFDLYPYLPPHSCNTVNSPRCGTEWGVVPMVPVLVLGAARRICSALRYVSFKGFRSQPIGAGRHLRVNFHQRAGVLLLFFVYLVFKRIHRTKMAETA